VGRLVAKSNSSECLKDKSDKDLNISNVSKAGDGSWGPRCGNIAYQDQEGELLIRQSVERKDIEERTRLNDRV